MCIILVVPENTALPSDDTLRTCWENNPDGCGIAYFDGFVRIEKYMKFKQSLQAIKSIHAELNDTTPIVIHFRVSTCGGKNLTNTHPFWIIKDKLCMFHNGQILNTKDCTPGLSDSHTFANYLKDSYKHHFGFHSNPAIQELLGDFCGNTNILVFFDRNKKIVFINKSFGEEVDGVWFSNKSYKTCKKSKVIQLHYNKTNIREEVVLDRCEFCGAYCEDIFRIACVDSNEVAAGLFYCSDCILAAYYKQTQDCFQYQFKGKWLKDYTREELKYILGY